MLAWPTYAEWRRDNDWKPLATAPRHLAVDVWVAKRGVRGNEYAVTYRRVHGCVFDGADWTGIPTGARAELWTVAMPDRRRDALTVSVSVCGRAYADAVHMPDGLQG